VGSDCHDVTQAISNEVCDPHDATFFLRGLVMDNVSDLKHDERRVAGITLSGGNKSSRNAA
jgi:hypothetical protein